MPLISGKLRLKLRLTEKVLQDNRREPPNIITTVSAHSKRFGIWIRLGVQGLHILPTCQAQNS